MISKFASMRDSWFTKIILGVTALSFMSLFGVSGYINSANNNKTVIQVGDLTVSQSEFNVALQKQLAKLRARGMVDDENADQIKNELIKVLAEAKLEDAIIQNAMNKYKIDFRPEVVGTIITNSPQFMGRDGRFDRALFNEYLRIENKSEAEVVQDVKQNLARQILVDTQVAYANVPQVLIKQMQKVLNQRRTFNYVKINNRDAKITRQPSEEELNRIYDDFSEELTVPEKRRITVLFLNNDMIEKSVEVTPEEIAAYYKEHIEEYEQPAKRQALQMVFESKEDAEAALAKLKEGADFAATAAELGQAAQDIDLGLVARSDLSDELADVIFALNVGETSEVVQIADSWQILKVTGEKAPQKMPKDAAEAQIAQEIRQDRSYEQTQDLMAQVEDEIGAGRSLEEVAQKFNVKPVAVSGITEDGTVETADTGLAEILSQNKDVIDAAFSYNEGEISSAIEDDNGILLVRVEEVMPSHVLPQEEAKAQLMQYWRETERAAVTQELAENIEQGLDEGDSLNVLAERYGLQLIKTMPLTRSENFADLTFENMKTLFDLPQDEAKVLQQGDDYVVAVTTNIYNDASAMSEADKNFLVRALHAELGREMADALLKDYASEFEVKVNYNRMGMVDDE